MLVCRVEKSRVFPTRSETGSMMEPPWRIRKRMSGDGEGAVSEGCVRQIVEYYILVEYFES